MHQEWGDPSLLLSTAEATPAVHGHCLTPKPGWPCGRMSSQTLVPLKQPACRSWDEQARIGFFTPLPKEQAHLK